MTGVVALVLAAGLSRRMAPAVKLLQPFGDTTVIGATLAQVGASAVADVLVVVGHEAELVTEAASAACPRCRVVRATRYMDGVAATLREGLSAVGDDATGVVVCLGDMPLVTSVTIDALLAGFDTAVARQPIVTPLYAGRHGNPVVWHRAHLPALGALEGDEGGRRLREHRAANLVSFEVGDPGVLIDVDTPQALDALRILGAA